MNIYEKSFKDLKQYCYFSSLSDGALQELAKKFQPVNLVAGDHIIKEGAPADSFYMIKRGEVEVTKKNEWDQRATLSVTGTGDAFGEMALLTCSPRFCSVTAKTDVSLLKLPKTVFDEIVREDSAFAGLMVERHQSFYRYNDFKTTQTFALMSPERVSAIIERLTERNFTAGENIVTQGEMGNTYFIIKSGQAEVHKQMMGDEAEHVATLSEGQGFGEEALLNNDPRSATVTAIGDTVVWCLSKKDFDSVAKSSFLKEVAAKDLLSDPARDFIYLDIRTKPEFDEEHIPGAVNIPLDELRRRYSELDKDKLYSVYCLLGQRSATAAFLLNSQGYSAESIKGGIMNWPGPIDKNTDGVHTPFKPT